MMLRWISELPPAIVFANDMKKPCDQRPDSANVSSVTLAANPEFQTRPDGIPGLQKVYRTAIYWGRESYVAPFTIAPSPDLNRTRRCACPTSSA